MMKKLNTLLAAAIMSVLGTAQAADQTLAMVVSTLNNPFFSNNPYHPLPQPLFTSQIKASLHTPSKIYLI